VQHKFPDDEYIQFKKFASGRRGKTNCLRSSDTDDEKPSARDTRTGFVLRSICLLPRVAPEYILIRLTKNSKVLV